MRMILGGIFDAFPKLKIMLGHLGETMPFLMERLDHLYHIPDLKPYRPSIQRIPSEVLRQNVYKTTSGRFLFPPYVMFLRSWEKTGYCLPPITQWNPYLTRLDLFRILIYQTKRSKKFSP